ncbi:LptF/LptG family permease [Lignipirellula cremea]|uniref:Putative permease YjgP/YjgQ family protein n=1 Tax=Lignipirellula cremea TaxID=2528010 RepID=A0A518DZB4_9BACT|nr:LptF/LptG family permease [Lignipirellula cremea]QDU97190.1 putative permease YjgP/YjgQ family protein [Lignipirellula cremea]
MPLITRQITSELVKMFAVTLGGLTLLMILVGVVQEALNQGLGIGPVLKLIPFLLPNALRFAAPGAVLFSACSVYGRISAGNEIVALKSGGVSPWATLKPAFVLAFILSLLTVWLNDLAVTWGREGVHRVVLQSVEQIAYGMLRSRRSYSTPKFDIVVQGVEDKILVRPTVVVQGSGDDPTITFTAREAEIRTIPQRGVLVFAMRDGAMEVGDQASLVFHDTIEHEVPLSDASNQDDVGGPSQIPLRSIAGESAKQQTEIAKLEESLAAQTAMDLLLGDHAEFLNARPQNQARGLEAARHRLYRLKTEPWRRWATGFSCFFFVWAGAPLAIRLRNADLFTSFGMCFLPILLVYYPLLAYGVDRAKCGGLPPYSVWLGNLILLLAGFWIMRKVVRY